MNERKNKRIVVQKAWNNFKKKSNFKDLDYVTFILSREETAHQNGIDECIFKACRGECISCGKLINIKTDSGVCRSCWELEMKRIKVIMKNKIKKRSEKDD